MPEFSFYLWIESLIKIHSLWSLTLKKLHDPFFVSIHFLSTFKFQLSPGTTKQTALSSWNLLGKII